MMVPKNNGVSGENEVQVHFQKSNAIAINVSVSVSLAKLCVIKP